MDKEFAPTFGVDIRARKVLRNYFLGDQLRDPVLSVVISSLPNMSTTLERRPASPPDIDDELSAALHALGAVIDRLSGLDLTTWTEARIEAGLRQLVEESRRLPAVTNALVAEAISRAVPSLRHTSSPSSWLRGVLRLSAGEARAWVRDAEDLVATRSLTSGERWPATRPAVAAAVAAGRISTEHARMITGVLRRVPSKVDRAEVVRAEVRLVRYACTHDPGGLARRCVEVLDELDPDGTLGKEPVEQERARSFHLGKQDKHGMYPVRGHLTPEVGALVQSALSPLSAPQPQADGSPDSRTVEQRDHDALGELARIALAGGTLPVRHGLPATLLLTTTVEDLEARTGVVSTAHGGRVTVRDLLRLAAQLRVIPVVMDSDGQVLHYGEEQRLATVAQRHVLWLQDVGCTYPGCAIPAVWCQAAHGAPFRDSHRTTIDDLALACGFHHRLIDSQEWMIKRIKGRAWLTPPRWIDPDQMPRINEYFRPLRQ